jgi:hypothetical protein
MFSLSTVVASHSTFFFGFLSFNTIVVGCDASITTVSLPDVDDVSAVAMTQRQDNARANRLTMTLAHA